MGEKPIVSVTYLPPVWSMVFSLHIKREKTVYSTTHKAAKNRPMDHTGET